MSPEPAEGKQAWPRQKQGFLTSLGRVFTAFELLIGPALMIGAWFIPTDGRWIMFGIGALAAAVLISDYNGDRTVKAETRAQHDRLDRSGIPATAEIVAIKEVDLGDGSGIQLRLRVEGNGLTPFEADSTDHRRRPHYEVGNRLHVVVDPSDNLFRFHR
ncbi:hypothetical protein ACQPZF_17795 [Actinosynnema sp. CS-041913]|uniref:hypothetical protein n=1 Tax=Actinosynnema sp. CS-041913 TaxID=3239917 RepID=UPI003D8BAA0E